VAQPEPFASIVRALSLRGDDSSDFDLNPDVHLPEGRTLRSAGVLCALQEVGGRVDVILTKRSARLKHHPGQIAFPGGKEEPEDGSPVDAALREAEEEIGLPRGLVEVLGTLPPHETVTGFVVTPVIGRITGTFAEMAEMGEVEEIFRVPLSHLADPANFRIEGRRWQGRRRHFYTVPYGPYYIWGATARILRALSERMSR
jgi:8-oxo-dGTP pyrophosphatase MutT (NUDIX family)